MVIGLAELGDVILCQITSKPYGSKKSIPLANNDFLEGSIAVDSFIRPDKIATLDTKLVDQLLGTLKSAKLDNVKMVLKKALEIN